MIEIKDIQGNIIYTTEINKGAKRKVSLMKEGYITLPFSIGNPIEFGLGSYVEVDGVRYEVVDLQKPTYNNSTGGYDYQLRLDAYYWKWKNKIFKFTPEVGGQEASWSLTAPLDVQMSIFLKNLTALGYTYGESEFEFSIDTSVENKAMSMTYSNTNMIDALSAMAESWNCEWWVTDNIIHFGRCEYGTAVDFEIHKNVAEMTRSESQSQYATRLYVFGSTRNLPSNYRPLDESVVVNGVVQRRLMLPADTPYIDAYQNMSEEEAIEEVVILEDVYPKFDGNISSVEEYESSVENEDGTTTTETFYRFKDDGFTFSKDYILEGQELRVRFESGSLNGMEFGAVFNPKGVDEASSEAQMFEIVASEDYGRKLPDATLHPKVGDKYVLIGWDSTKIADLGLVSKAEIELREEGLKISAKRKIDPSTYNCKMFSDYMYGLDANGNQNSAYAKHFELGDKVKLINAAYFTEGRESRIIGYEYNLDFPFDNTVYTIGETASYSRLGELESKLESLTLGGQTYAGGGGSGVYVIGTNDTTKPTNRNVYSSLRSDNNYLSKTKDDSTPHNLGVGKTLTIGEAVQSANFSMGELGSGFILKNVGGKSYFEVDEMLVRKVAYFVELVIKQLSHVGGEIILSPASIQCSRVVEYEEFYRCYFIAEKDGKTIENEFKVGDQARAQSFNVKEGTSHNVRNQYYWCLVIGTGDDYIDLSKIDCDSSSQAPLAGDDIVQLGNINDPARQNAIILSTIGNDAPSIKQYAGINGYSLEGKEVTVISPSGNKLVGDFISTSGNILGLIDDLGARLDDVQYQTDKHYTLWFFNYEPTLDNYPASEWIDSPSRAEHVQDIFYNEESGRAYRFVQRNSDVYAWIEITDHETIKALEKAAEAQEAADSKIRNFTSTPVTPYDKGDRWSNATWGNLYENDDLVCINPKTEAESFDISDWQLATGLGEKRFKSEISRLDEEISLKVSSKEVDGRISAAGIQIKYDISKIYATQEGVNASLAAKVSFDPNTGKITSNISISANQINMNADEYISIINQGTTTISASRLNLVGQVTFSMLDSGAQSTINGKATQADIDTSISSFKGTIISGGYIKTSLIDVDSLYVKNLRTYSSLGSILIEAGEIIGYDKSNIELFSVIPRTDGVEITVGKDTGNHTSIVNSSFSVWSNNGSCSLSDTGIKLHNSASIANLSLGNINPSLLTIDTDFYVASGNISLPAASGHKGKMLFIKLKDGYIITSSSKVYAGADYELWGVSNGNYQKDYSGGRSLLFISDGTNWYEYQCFA